MALSQTRDHHCDLSSIEIPTSATFDLGIAAKYMMKRDNGHEDIVEANLRIDHELLQALKRLGVVKSQYDLGRLCGKGCSYYSCMRAKGYGLKLGSLTFLSVRIGSTIRASQNARVVKVLKYAQNLIQNSIEEKCRLKEHCLRVGWI